MLLLAVASIVYEDYKNRPKKHNLVFAQFRHTRYLDARLVWNQLVPILGLAIKSRACILAQPAMSLVTVPEDWISNFRPAS